MGHLEEGVGVGRGNWKYLQSLKYTRNHSLNLSKICYLNFSFFFIHLTANMIFPFFLCQAEELRKLVLLFGFWARLFRHVSQAAFSTILFSFRQVFSTCCEIPRWKEGVLVERIDCSRLKSLHEFAVFSLRVDGKVWAHFKGFKSKMRHLRQLWSFGGWSGNAQLLHNQKLSSWMEMFTFQSWCFTQVTIITIQHFCCFPHFCTSTKLTHPKLSLSSSPFKKLSRKTHNEKVHRRIKNHWSHDDISLVFFSSSHSFNCLTNYNVFHFLFYIYYYFTIIEVFEQRWALAIKRSLYSSYFMECFFLLHCIIKR